MSKVCLQRDTEDIVSKIRRAHDPAHLMRNIGITLNDDGSVFDKKTRRFFTSIVEWSRNASK